MSWLIRDALFERWVLKLDNWRQRIVWTDKVGRAFRWDDAGDAARAAQRVDALGHPCTLEAAPSDSDRPAARDEATEGGAPLGVPDLAGVGGRGTPPREGAAERLAPPLQPGEEGSSEAHSRPSPEICSSGDTSPPRCRVCGLELVPPRGPRGGPRSTCSVRCRKELQRRRDFDRRTAELRGAP